MFPVDTLPPEYATVQTWFGYITEEPSAGPRPPSHGPADLPAFLTDVVSPHESHGNYEAYSATGCSDDDGIWSCGGRWQLSEHYASTWAAQAGINGMSSHAEQWPPRIQDRVALYLYRVNGRGMWCNYTDYC